ncbi:hypothetical protein LCGC14_1610350 [marine sediment metagenome]|uniref:Uncharacterized protein n=1 Tax=marine sediment metagenome TaxID=412755 RepID=A0A0F9L8P6_9ZZZZ
MTPERIDSFILRIREHEQEIENFYRENPEFAHFVRMADTLGTFTALSHCTTTQSHWNCFVEVSAIGMALHALVWVNPKALDEIYEEFKEDFKEFIPNGYLFWDIIETREYPIPEELLSHTHDIIGDDGLEDC